MFHTPHEEFSERDSSGGRTAAEEVGGGIGPLEGALLLGQGMTPIDGTVLRVGDGSGGIGAIAGGGPVAWVLHGVSPR